MKQATHVEPQWNLQDLEPSDRYGWSAVVRNSLPLVALLTLAPLLAARSIAAAWSLAPLIGLFLYRITIVMHDHTHGTLFRSSRLNTWVGQLLGAMTGIDFRRFKSQHWKHHRLYGQLGDPQGFHYLGIQRLNRPQFAWHLIKPIFGANLRHVLPESLLYPPNLWRALRRGHVAIALAVQLAMFLVVTGGARYLTLAFLPFASAATFGLFFSQIRGLAEHGSLDSGKAGYVRSHASRALERILLYDLHFNYHAVHHRWPHCPSRHLPLIHDRYFAAQAPLERSMIGTVIAIGTRLSS